MSFPNRIAPIRLIKPGAFFDLSCQLRLPADLIGDFCQYEIAAGARSAFLLPKVGNATQHAVLQKALQLSSYAPTELCKHGIVFREIYQKIKKQRNWQVKLLCFSNEWKALLPHLFLSNAMQQNALWEELSRWEIALTALQNQKKIKPNPYYDNIVRQLLLMANNHLPGFVPASDDSLAPVSLIQKAYLDFYRIKQPPIVMVPGLIQDHAHVYLSVDYYTGLISPELLSRRDQFVTNQRVLTVLRLWNEYVGNLLKHVDVDFFSYVSSEKHGVRDSYQILQEDDRFLEAIQHFSLEPLRAAYLRGVVRLSQTKEK